MAGPKADKLTKERRVEVVYRLILNGYNTAQILQDTSEWRVSERQRMSYIAEAWKRIEIVNEVDLAEHKRRAVAAQYQLLREAKTVKEKSIVWAALSRLLGMVAPKAVELSGKDGGPVEQVIRFEWVDDNNHDDTDATAA